MRNLLFLIIFCAGLFFVFRQKPDQRASTEPESATAEAPTAMAPVEKPIELKSTPTSKKLRIDLSAPAPAKAAPAERPLADQLNEAINLFPSLNKSYSESDPKNVLKVGEAIERAKQELDKDPSSLETVGKFFETCATSESAPASLRSLCWKRLTSVSEKFHYNIDSANAEVPDTIKKLAEYQIQ